MAISVNILVTLSKKNYILRQIQMIEPLLLKSVSSQRSDQNKKNYVLTVSQLMQKFQTKSPARNDKCLTDRVCSTTKRINTATAERLINLAMPKKNSEQTSSTVMREIKIGTPRNNGEARRQVQNKKQLALTRSNKSCKDNPFKIVKNNIKKQGVQFKEKPIPMFKIPLSKKAQDLSLTNKIQLNINLHRQSKNRKQTAFSYKRQKIAQSTKIIKDERFFRKSTKASTTVSLKSKHTVSMQHLQEDNDILFSKYIASSQTLPSIKKLGEDMICKLQETKQKIYQHIYSLDKKLLDEFDIDEGKKALVICLKKRSQKEQQKNKNQMVSA